MSEVASYNSCPAWPKVFESVEVRRSDAFARAIGRLPEEPVLP
jgi:hypothetical protein